MSLLIFSNFPFESFHSKSGFVLVKLSLSDFDFVAQTHTFNVFHIESPSAFFLFHRWRIFCSSSRILHFAKLPKDNFNIDLHFNLVKS